MLEDLRLLAKGEPPIHARRQVDIDALAGIEQGAQTIDLEPHTFRRSLSWDSPLMIAMLIGCGISVILNIILLLVTLSR
jgi:hypothetical protein